MRGGRRGFGQGFGRHFAGHFGRGPDRALRRAVGVLAALLLAAGGAEARGKPGYRVPERPTFVAQECWWPRPPAVSADTTITCGTVAVPADRSERRSAWLQLAVARLHRAGADPAAPPIVVLHGGPGGTVLTGAPLGLATLPSLAERDVIAFDQRGAGRSLPSLECPEMEQSMLAALGAAAPWKDELAAHRRAARACRQRLVRSGVDLDDYDTPASVGDLESIRRALGVARWHVFGSSYGTRLALDYVRRHPERVRSLLLDAVYPPGLDAGARALALPQRALDGLAAACAADAACRSAYGDLGATIDAAAAAFDAAPATLDASYTLRGQVHTRSFTLTGADVRGGLFSALYQTSLIPLLPSVARDFAAGNRGILPLFIGLGVPQLLQLSEGAYLSVECADARGPYSRKRLAKQLRRAGRDGLVLLGFAQPFCDLWRVEPVPAGFHEPVTADVPALLFAGTLDPITPHEDALIQAARLPGARLVSGPRAGHGALGFDACTFSAALAFWAEPEGPLPACLDALAPLPFATN
jgi:pimeloyl-ACP methyl ester carboxylesterase